MVEHKIRLNITPGGKPQVVKVSQYDHESRNIIIDMYDGSDPYPIPSGTTVEIRGTKPSGLGFIYPCTFADSVVTATVKNQMTAEPGNVSCEIVFTKGTTILGSANFILAVEKAGVTAETIVSSDTFDSIIRDEVRECANEKLIELTVDTELDPDSVNPVSNSIISNGVASALRGKMSGDMVAVKDVSPIEHYPIVKVRGKNLFNKNNYVDFSGIKMFDISELEVGKKYVLSSNKPITWFKISTYPQNYNSVSFSDVKGMYEIPFTMARHEHIPLENPQYLLLSVNADYSNNPIKSIDELDDYNIQIEEGDTPTTYTPWVDPSTVLVKKCGKTVFSKALQEVTLEGQWSSILVAQVLVGAGDYVANCRFSQLGTDKGNVALSVRDYDDHAITLKHVASTATAGVLTAPFKVEKGKKGFRIYLYSNYSDDSLSTDCDFSNIYVESGSEPTGYEAYTSATHTPNEDGYIDDMVSISPNMTLITNNENAIVECEYNRDVTKVVNKLVNAIVALGGSV